MGSLLPLSTRIGRAEENREKGRPRERKREKEGRRDKERLTPRCEDLSPPLHIGNFCLLMPVFNYLYFRNRAVIFFEICNIYANQMVITVAVSIILIS